jgi:hypothetical protein
LDTDIEIMPDLLKSALNYGKKYINRTIGEILREWALSDIFDDQFPFKEN